MNKKDFTKAKLSETCKLVTDGTHDTPKTLPSGIPFIKAKQIANGFIDFDDCEYITYKDHLKVISRSKPEKGDILFAHIGATLGATAYINTDIEFSIKNVALFKPDPKLIYPQYLYYLVKNDDFQRNIIGRRTGAAQPFVSLEILRNQEIYFHTELETQRKIASILSAYDHLIENNNKRIKILEEMAQVIYQEWFVHYHIPEYENIRLINSGTELGEIPDGWEIGILSDIIDNISESTYPGQHLNNLVYLPIDCLPRKRLALTDSKPIFEAQSSLILFKTHDILFGAMRPYFHKVIITPFNGVTRKTCFVLRPKYAELLAYATLVMFQRKTIDYANKLSKGSTIPYVSWDGSLANMMVLIPPKEHIEVF